jgi:DNA end-binding protein Ku
MDELTLPEDQVEIKPAEKAMAEQLVASMTGDFKADDYRDDYRQALMAVIEAKVAGETPQPAARAEPTNIADLMSALEASVATAREQRAAGKAAEGDGKAAPTRGKAATSRGKASTSSRKAAASGDGKAASADEVAEAPAARQRRRKTA